MGKEETVEVILSVVGFILLLVIWMAYYGIFTENYKHLRENVQLTVINITRTSQFLPTYATLMWLSIVSPALYIPCQIPISIAEGYSFFCFFSLIVNYFGGPNKVIDMIQTKFDNGKKPIFPCCCPVEAKAFYSRVLQALYHFILTRTGFLFVLATLQLAMKYGDLSDAGHRAIYGMAIFFQIISLGFLVNGFGSLVMFFELFLDETQNLWGIPKIMLLKFSVGLIVIQGLIEQFLFAANKLDVADSSNLSGEDRAQMMYCFVVLVEYFLLAYVYYWAFSVDVAPPGAMKRGESDGDALKTPDATEGEEEEEIINITFSEFAAQVLNPRSVWQNLDPDASLTQPLTQADENAA